MAGVVREFSSGAAASPLRQCFQGMTITRAARFSSRFVVWRVWCRLHFFGCTAAPKRFYMYVVVARLALLAASLEIERTDPNPEVY